MRVGLVVIAALVVFDLAVAVAAALGALEPLVAVGLLLTNPLALILDRQIRNRRAAAGRRRS